jgi:hypothetical protein
MKSHHSFIKFGELANENYLGELGRNIVKLAKAPGPSRCIARLGVSDPRLGETEKFPITIIIEEILEDINNRYNLDLVQIEHNGNLIIVCGLGRNPIDQDIYTIPITLAPHLDEITYMVKNEMDETGKYHFLIPLCNPPAEIKRENNRVKILGFRGNHRRKFLETGIGTIHIKEENMEGQNRPKRYCLKLNSGDILLGDLVIQDYCHQKMEQQFNIDSIIHMKAMDDRVGCIAQIYVLAELAKRGFLKKAKVILAGDEEGLNKDVSWARLIRPTFRKYCRADGIIVICDGFDGRRMGDEFCSQQGEYSSQALLTSYPGSASGGGDPGILSLFRDVIADVSVQSGFECKVTTSYVSRSIDPKIMDDFPLMGFIDWSNGQIGGKDAICHIDESVLLRQVINIIGTTCIAVKSLSETYR